MRKSLKFISSPFFFVTRYFKKSKIDNFVGGLIFGAIFSLLVNVVTIQFQESIQRQRVLEALENEIISNALLANNVMSQYQQKKDKNEMPNYYDYTNTYSRRVWENSESLQYVIQLDPDLQSKLSTYYEILVVQMNGMIIKNETFKDELLSDCYMGISKKMREDLESCKQEYYSLLLNESSTAAEIGKTSFDLLNNFHPTQERLNNPFLRLIMGSKSIRVLSGS